MSKSKTLIRKDSMELNGDDLSHLITLELSELESVRNKTIEDMYDPTLNEFQKRSLQWLIDYIESLMFQKTGAYYVANSFSLPSESENIIYSTSKKALGKKPQCHFKIDEWSELLIKVFRHDVKFEKVGTATSNEFTFKQLGWRGQRLEILREFSVGIYKASSDTINSRISELNKQISYMVDLNTVPFEYDRSKKCRISNVKIEFYDADEKFVDTKLRMDRFIMNDANFHKSYDEGYVPNSNDRNMSLDDYDDEE